MSNRTRQNNKTADRKTESNDSPGIPDREETSEEPGLPSDPLIKIKFNISLVPTENVLIYRQKYRIDRNCRQNMRQTARTRGESRAIDGRAAATMQRLALVCV